MPWKEVSAVSQRREFIELALSEESNISVLCRRFNISRKTGYKWLNRSMVEGLSGLRDRRRAPKTSPKRTPPELESLVVELRDKHPFWGGRKLNARLKALGYAPPAASTITDILRRNGRLEPAECDKHKAWKSFERNAPNSLWQMDFKGDFPLSRGGRCHPLAILDDHSRYAVCLKACSGQKRPGVQNALVAAFRRYGMPDSILMDNGSCWGPHNESGYHTVLTAWLIRLGVGVSHGRIYHPQTQGKVERFNRTLKAEAISTRVFTDIPHCQRHFDSWRNVYNFERPHESLDMLAPISRYRPSPIEFPETLPRIEYSSADIVLNVNKNSTIGFKGKVFRIGYAFAGQPIALRHTSEDGVFKAFYCHAHIVTLNVKTGESVNMARSAPPLPGERG